MRVINKSYVRAFEDAGLRTVLRGEDTLARRILQAHEEGIPVMAVVGAREADSGNVSLRERDGSQRVLPLAQAVAELAGRA